MATWNLLGTATVSGTSTTAITFSSIDQSYKDLCIIGSLTDVTGSSGYAPITWLMKTAAGGAMSLGGGYMEMSYNSLTPSSTQFASASSTISYINSADSTSGNSPIYFYCYDYSSTTVAKNFYLFHGTTGRSPYLAASSFRMHKWLFNDGSNSPLGTIDVRTSQANLQAGSTLSLYGIEG